MALLDGILLHHPTKWQICQKVGGVANVCFIPPDCEGEVHRMIDWDCGPGNMFVGAAMRYCADGQIEHDKDAEWARQDTIDQEVIDKFLDKNPYINHDGP